MAVEQLFSELNLRQKQYTNYRLIRLIVILMAAAFDISSIKNIKSSPAIYQLYQRYLRGIGLSVSKNLPQLPVVLLKMFNPAIKFVEGQKYYKPVHASSSGELIDKLLDTYAFAIDNASLRELFTVR